jgi:hypothetical protein
MGDVIFQYQTVALAYRYTVQGVELGEEHKARRQACHVEAAYEWRQADDGTHEQRDPNTVRPAVAS